MNGYLWAMVLLSTVGFLLVVLGPLPWLWLHEPRLARLTLWTMAGSLALTLGLQALTDVPRPPPVVDWLPTPPLGSFPSGHVVLMGIAVVAVIARDRAAAWVLPLAIGVAFSRVALGHHHPVDVWAGAAIGIGLGVGTVGLARSSNDDPWRWRWSLWPQLGLVVAITLLAYTGALRGASWLALPGTDKALHFLLFGALGFGTHFACRGRTSWGIPWAIALPLLVALAEELLQATSPHRTADALDLLADALGLLTFHLLARRMSRQTPDRSASPTKGATMGHANARTAQR